MSHWSIRKGLDNMVLLRAVAIRKTNKSRSETDVVSKETILKRQFVLAHQVPAK